MDPHKELIDKVRDRYENDPLVRKEFEKVATPFILKFINMNKYGHLVKYKEEVIMDVIMQVVDFIKREEIRKGLEAILYHPTKWAIASDLRLNRFDYSELDTKTYQCDKINPEEAVIEKDDFYFKKFILKECLKRLTKKQQEVIQLWKRFGKWTKVADHLGESRSNIAQAKKRAFANLRECISELQEVYRFS